MSGIYGELLNFPQEQGHDIQLRVFGSNHYSRYENVNGYTVVYDETKGVFCYAHVPDNRLVSSGVPSADAPPQGVVRHLEESHAVVSAKIEEHLAHASPQARDMHNVDRTFGPNRGLLNGRQLSIGQVRGLTILVNFADVTSTTTAADVEKMINGPDFTENGNISSVRDYFLTVSNGKLDYTNTVIGPFTLSKKRQHYINDLLVEEALQLAVDSGVDLSEFDSRDEGIVDALNILYAGQSVYQGDLWPHNSFVEIEHDEVSTNLYLLTGLGRTPSELSIGTFCHENGHLLCRFPDMYDYGSRDADDKDSSGIGRYCLMGSGNHLDFGRSPSPVCAYLRDLAGWCDNVVELNSHDDYKAIHGDYGTVMKYHTSEPNEYFVVENRTKQGLDRALPSSGLAVYHCDIFGSNELQQGTADKHYQCALLQADGRRDLENDPSNQGDSGDLFGQVDGIALASMTNPNTREWDQRDSELIISQISTPGDEIRFRTVGGIPAASVVAESEPELSIPDDRLGGVNDSIFVNESGIVHRIQISIDITHTYIGDLVVRLTSPTGATDLLHVRQGGSSDDLLGSYDSNRPGELANMIGKPMMGRWMLNVSDRASIDRGTFVKWKIEIEGSSLGSQDTLTASNMHAVNG